jgi:hypothetical protein
VKIIPLDSKISKAHFSVLLANCSADNQFQDAAAKKYTTANTVTVCKGVYL